MDTLQTLPSDTELVLAARAGDDAARRELFTRHLDTVRAVCAGRLRSPHDAADAVQETVVRALSQLSQLDDPERVDAWLRAIAVRVCADQCRDRARVVCLADPGDDRVAADPAPADVLVAAEDAARLRDRLGRLGERDRRALWLRDAIGLSVPEVAGDLGLTEGSARVLLSRARNRLRATYHGVAGLALAAWIPLRRRLAGFSGTTPIDLRAALAAQVAITVVVGVTPQAPVPAAPTGPALAAPAPVADLPPSGPELPPLPTPAASLTAAPARTEPAPSRPAPDERSGPVVGIDDAPPPGTEPVEVEAHDGDGQVVELLVYLGDTFAAGDEQSDDQPDGQRDRGDGTGDSSPDHDRVDISPPDLLGR